MKPAKRKRVCAPKVAAPAKVQATSASSTDRKAMAPAAHATPVIVLASHCSVKDAAMLKNSLCNAAGESGPVTLDVRSLERIDTATLQLLCAFVRDRNARAQKVAWLGPSAALGEAARLLGVAAMLALSENDATGAAA